MTTVAFDDGVVAAAVARGLDAVRDLPHPANDALCAADKYARMGRDFASSAWKHLDDDDLAQASNKAWALVAETVKAISLHHGRVIHTHRGILQVVEELARLVDAAGDTETRRWIRNSFSVAQLLHSNFYEDRMPDGAVIDGLIQCEELSARLYALFWGEGAAAHAA